MNRREFLIESGKATAGYSLSSITNFAMAKLAAASALPISKNGALAALISDLEKQVPTAMEETSIPGLSIAIIKDAKLQWCRGFGVKDVASREPVDTEAIFEAASMSKPVFAYLVMKL